MVSPETAAFEWIDARRDALIDFACRLISTPSANPPGNEREAALVAQRELQTLELTQTEIVGPSPERANLLCWLDTGRAGRVLLLNGHLDTKPPDPLDEWVTNPYQGVVRDGRLYGLGSADMKGPDAALVYALAAVQAVDAPIRGRVILALSADEEGPALHGARYLVQDMELRADAALIAEPCGIQRDWEMLPLISRGISCLRFTVHGTQTHSSIGDRIPTVNASVEAARLLVFLHDHLELHYPETDLCPTGPTKNLGAVLRGGEAIAKVPGRAEFTADIRTLPGMTQAQLAADVEAALTAFRQARPGVRVEWSFFEGPLAWTRPTEISPDEPLVDVVRQAAARVLGDAPPLGYFPGGTDAIWWQGDAGIPTIPGFGPGLLANCHKPNEYVEVEELIRAAKIYALTILAYLSEAG